LLQMMQVELDRQQLAQKTQQFLEANHSHLCDSDLRKTV
jgi:hypothetical protein